MLKELGIYRGVNLGGWFSQCDYSEERLNGFITEPDFAQIAAWGFDHVEIARRCSGVSQHLPESPLAVT